MINRRIFLASVPLVLSGCAIPRTAVDGATLGQNQGLLALRLSANRTGRLGLMPHEESTFGARFAENMFGAKETVMFKENQDQFLVIPMDAGDYMWSKIEIGTQYAWLLESTRVRVKPGRITYIGNVRIFVAGSKFSVRVTDREEEMKEHLREKYPQFSTALSFEKSLAEMNI